MWITIVIQNISTYADLSLTESNLINEAKSMYFLSTQANQQKNRKTLLCASFLGTKNNFSDIMLHNIIKTKGQCDWALIFYSGEKDELISICNKPEIQLNLIYCSRSKHSLGPKRYINITEAVSIQIPISKTLMYDDLLPFLPNYEKVFLMDEDIFLLKTNLQLLLKTWNCAFNPSPLIVQPLLKDIGPTNRKIYQKVNTWKKSHYHDIIATAIGFIEIQTPLIDSRFFEWFVSKVLSNLKQSSREFGSDWGPDYTWCGAAKSYQEQVLNVTKYSIPCALITAKGTSVIHMNRKSIELFRDGTKFYKNAGKELLQLYRKTFPNWATSRLAKTFSPFIHNHSFSHYPNGGMARSLVPSCN